MIFQKYKDAKETSIEVGDLSRYTFTFCYLRDAEEVLLGECANKCEKICN